MENSAALNLEAYTKAKKLEKIIVFSMLAFVVVVVVAIISAVVVGKARKSLANYNNLIAELQAEERYLKSSVDYMETGTYLEERARGELGMIQDGETYYVFD